MWWQSKYFFVIAGLTYIIFFFLLFQIRSDHIIKQLLEPLDMTRQLIGNGIHTMEDDGLNWMEDAACDAFTGPAAPFCDWVVSSPSKFESVP